MFPWMDEEGDEVAGAEGFMAAGGDCATSVFSVCVATEAVAKEDDGEGHCAAPFPPTYGVPHC